MEYNKKCAFCGERFIAKRSDKKFCSNTCRVKFSYRKNEFSFIETPIVGCYEPEKIRIDTVNNKLSAIINKVESYNDTQQKVFSFLTKKTNEPLISGVYIFILLETLKKSIIEINIIKEELQEFKQTL